MTKSKKMIIIVAAIVLALVLIGLWVLFNNGLLGVHFHKEAKEGQIKVACVGDSITYGHGVSEWLHYNYPAQLQDMLGDKYHVENFGHSGRTLSDNGDKPYTESEQYGLSLEYCPDILRILKCQLIPRTNSHFLPYRLIEVVISSAVGCPTSTSGISTNSSVFMGLPNGSEPV